MIEESLPSIVLPHEPLYQYHAAGIARLPPDIPSIEDEPVQTGFIVAVA